MKRKSIFEPETKQKKSKTSHKVVIYWERIYRYVEKLEKLYGNNVHVSKGELGLPSPEEYKLVPFSHMDELGALFEMQEIEEDTLSLACKDHQPGTGIAFHLSEAAAPITRIFYDPSSIDKKLEEKITKLAKEKKIEIVKIDRVYLLTEGTKDIQLQYLPKAKPKENKP